MGTYRALAAIVWVSMASGAAAQNTNCLGELRDDDVRGNLDVAVACTVAGADIRGNVTIYSGGSLTGRDVFIRGNIDARRADFLALTGSRVDGNVRLEELVGDRSSIEDTQISGNVSLLANRSLLEFVDNEVDGNVRVVGNVGGVVIAGNEIDGSLECSDNAPAPTGGGNDARRENGQCARLAPTGGTSEPPRTENPPRNEDPPAVPPRAEAPPTDNPPPAGGAAPAPVVAPPPAAVVPKADLTAPKLTLRGAATVSVVVNSTYTDAGAIAMDDVDGDLTGRIVAASNVDTKTLGIYAVTYSVSDQAGNAAAAVTRTVHVMPEATAQEGPGGGGALGLELLALSMVAWGRRILRRALALHDSCRALSANEARGCRRAAQGPIGRRHALADYQI